MTEKKHQRIRQHAYLFCKLLVFLAFDICLQSLEKPLAFQLLLSYSVVDRNHSPSFVVDITLSRIAVLPGIAAA
jgi:hypothetical protein